MEDKQKMKNDIFNELTVLRQRITEIEVAFENFRKTAEETDKELESISMELAISLFEVFEALKRISSGDPYVRVSEESEIELISKLKHMINITAENIGEIVDQSHEFAMALAEHFDVLHRVAKGDLNARISGESAGELLEALKKLTNEMIESIHREIAHREQMEKELIASEERYRRLFETSRDGLLLIEKQTGNVINSNPAVEKLLGYSSGELIGKRLKEVSLLKHLQNVESIIQTLDMVGYVHYYDVPIETKGGQSIDTEIYLIDRASLIQCNIRDITEHKRAEESLRKLSRAVEQSPTSVIITDLQGNIEYVNPKFTKITGYSFEEMLGKNPRILKSGETTAEEYRKLWNTITSGGEWHGVFHNRRKDGTLFWERASISAIRDASGSPTHFIAIKEDITEQKSLEDQYRQAQKMEAVGQLAGGIAHDFNNILTAMIGYAHILKMKMQETDPSRTYADHILSLSDRAANLTQSLLAFSRKQIINPVPVNLNKIIRTVEKLLSRIIGEDIRLEAELSEEDLIILADHVQIEQALMNLAANARDAMPKGGLLNIRTETADIDDEFAREHGFRKEGRYALISVTDTGIGMDRETKERIFEPFFTTKEAGKGTGLGLSMLYGIIKQHEGYINVYSEPGKGTTFRIYLPLIHAAAWEIKPEVMQPIKTGTETILVAEDETEVREFTKKLLEAYGYKVIEARDGGDAVDKFRLHKNRIALVLLDVIMPNKNGREAYEEIQKITPGTKVLFTSGHPADHIDGMIAEGSRFISKPVSPSTLLNQIRKILDT